MMDHGATRCLGVVRVIIAIPAVERMGEVGLTPVLWSAIAVTLILPSLLIALKATLASKSFARTAVR